MFPVVEENSSILRDGYMTNDGNGAYSHAQYTQHFVNMVTILCRGKCCALRAYTNLANALRRSSAGEYTLFFRDFTFQLSSKVTT